MAVNDQVITDKYAIYNGDCIEVMQSLPDGCVDLSVYSPPFCGLYNYSSSDRDLSNCDSYEDFFAHYEFVVRELHRMTKPGRISGVHVMDVPSSNSGCDHLIDFPGDVIRLHEKCGWKYIARHCIWKEPLAVRNRTMQHNLSHRTIVEDGTLGGVASADYLLLFRRSGENKVPVNHDHGLLSYAGERVMPQELQKYKGWKGKQTENRFSHWIWRQYASSFWDDIRIDNVIKPHESWREEDEKHVHPLQLDVIERCIQLRSNPGETVFTPFLGIGSEAYQAVKSGRRGVGVELKPAYFRQAVSNMARALAESHEQEDLFSVDTPPAT